MATDMKRFFSYLLLSSSLLILPLSAAISDTAPPASSQHSILTPKEPTQTTTPDPTTPVVDANEEIPGPTYQGAFTKMLLTLGGLLALVFLTIWLLRKLTQGKIGSYGKKQINVLERRPLSPKTVLYIVEVEGKKILVAESQLEIKRLATIDLYSEEDD